MSVSERLHPRARDERRAASELYGSRSGQVTPIPWPLSRAQQDEDLAVEHAERLDWMAGEIAQRIHSADSLRDLIAQVLVQAERVTWPPQAVEPAPSEDEVPF